MSNLLRKIILFLIISNPIIINCTFGDSLDNIIENIDKKIEYYDRISQIDSFLIIKLDNKDSVIFTNSIPREKYEYINYFDEISSFQIRFSGFDDPTYFLVNRINGVITNVYREIKFSPNKRKFITRSNHQYKIISYDHGKFINEVGEDSLWWIPNDLKWISNDSVIISMGVVFGKSNNGDFFSYFSNIGYTSLFFENNIWFIDKRIMYLEQKDSITSFNHGR